jgi:hypothetical protein
MIHQKKNMIEVLSVCGALLLSLVSFSGCTSNQTANQTTNSNSDVLLGTWVGTMKPVGSGFGNNTTLSQMTFRNDGVELMLVSQRGSFSMNYSYTFTTSTLVLQPVYSGRNGSFGGRQPFNGSRPWNESRPWNGTRPPENGTWPPNGTRPYNGSWPSNWTRSGNQTVPEERRGFMQITFTYTYDEQTRTLYLNGSPFTKVR